jgi:hypothetical protein
VVIRLHTDAENRGTGAYQLLTPYKHGVPHVDCEGPSAVTRTNLLLPPGRKAPETRPHREPNRVVTHTAHAAGNASPADTAAAGAVIQVRRVSNYWVAMVC